MNVKTEHMIAMLTPIALTPGVHLAVRARSDMRRMVMFAEVKMSI